MNAVKNTFSQRPLLYLMISLVLGVAVGIAVIPVLFRIAPGDTRRNRMILQAIRASKPPVPNGCFLGSSIVMNGIDTRLLSNPEFTLWNFSSPGQQLLESSLILTQTPENYKTVLVGVSATTLCEHMPDISENKATSYIMYGYSLPVSYLDLVRTVQADTLLEIAENPYLKNVIQGRWIIKNGLDMWIRNMLRRDLDMERSQTDLFYPSPYKKKVNPEALQMLLERYCQAREANDATITNENRRILEYMSAELQEREGRLIVVILPEHPAKRQATEPAYYIRFQEQLVQLQQDLHIEIVNCIDLLSSAQFIDHVHPTVPEARY